MPEGIRAKKLNDLVSVFYESLFREHPDWPSLVPPSDQPLKSWLAELVDQYLGGKR